MRYESRLEGLATWLRSGCLLLLVPARMEKRWAPKVRVRLRGRVAGVLASMCKLRERAEFVGNWSVCSRVVRTKSGKETAPTWVSSTGAREEGSLESGAVGDGDCEIVRAKCSRVGDEVELNLSTDAGTWAE